MTVNLSDFLDYTFEYPRVTTDGLTFTTWKGLKLYLITGQVEKQYLEVKDFKSKIDWVYVSNLQELLMKEIEYNLKIKFGQIYTHDLVFMRDLDYNLMKGSERNWYRLLQLYFVCIKH